MSTYYKWNKYNCEEKKFEEKKTGNFYGFATSAGYDPNMKLYVYSKDTFSGKTEALYPLATLGLNETLTLSPGTFYGFSSVAYRDSGDYYWFDEAYITKSGATVKFINLNQSGNYKVTLVSGDVYKVYYEDVKVGSSLGNVYSTNPSSYPNGGSKGGYWYEGRTELTSPTAPSNLQYPNPITTPKVTVSWDAATSNVPSYSVSKYELIYALNGSGTWKTAGTPSGTSLEVTVPTEATSIQFRVRAQDSNGQWGNYTTGVVSNVLVAPTLTVPSIAMQNQPITVNWTSITGATSYTLQRKANTDTDWVQVYSGPNLTFTETVGAWTSVQYRVQAVFSSGAGGWATSSSIPVASASALVISGSDEDLGILTSDIPYTVSSDTGNQITLTRKVNGNLVTTITIQSGFAYTIPVMDLPTGSGTVEITASVNATGGSGSISETRTWTYTKKSIIFPNKAGVGVLTQGDNNVLPATIAEAVKVPTNWGGTLDKALELMYDSVNSAVVSTGTYEGTGTFGQSNPNSLVMSREPSVVTIYGGGKTLVISSKDTSSTAYIDGTNVKWYSDVSAEEQMNAEGVTYSYVAVSKGVQE